jgi:hypothetical protein
MLGHNQNNGAQQKIIKENYQKTYLPVLGLEIILIGANPRWVAI